MKRFLKILRNTVLSLIGLLLLLVLLVNLTPVQNYIARRAVKILSDKLQTKVSIEHVRIDFLNHALIQGLYIEDRAHDTLLYAGEASVRITDWFFLKKEVPVLSYVGLKDAYGHLYRTDTSKEWNYQFVIDAFDNGKPKSKKQQQTFEIDLKKIELSNVRFHMDDAWVGNDIDLDFGSVVLDAKQVDLDKKLVDLAALNVDNAAIIMRDYTGGKPRDSVKKPKAGIDTTAFNPDGWVFRLGNLSLENCRYALTSSSKPAPVREFDAQHMDVTGINLQAGQLEIIGDTLHGRVDHLAATERCGFKLLNLQGDITVSPNESVIENLLLQTPGSSIGNYYAMRYERFPAFKDYIEAVNMEVRLDSTVVEFDEIGYFAPQLREYPAKVVARGNFNGTVGNFKMADFAFSDGRSGVQGEELAMTGLPDIYSTFIHYTGGAIRATGPDVLNYVPALKGNPNLALEKLSFIRFVGGFTGYLENFAANGVLETNLGTARSDVEMRLPIQRNGSPIYSGTVSTSGFDLGTLLRQPFLGSITMNGQIQGNGFDPLTSQLHVKTEISSLGLLGYTYHNITADGVLAQKKFDGKLLVNDSNLAAAFNGTADFSGERPLIVAEANILYSNFQKMGLTKEPITLAADFDLNASGSNIDNFLGDARLYNVNLVRNAVKLDVDSVTVSAMETGPGTKELRVESNLLTARVSGHYELSRLASSTQYFLAGYLPNYIPKPSGYSPDQDIDFELITRRIDGLFRIFIPEIQGFNNTSIRGSLNTTEQQLALAIRVPEGTVSGVKLTNVILDGSGDFRQLSINGDVAQLNIGDSLLNLTANISTTLGNDSVRFNVETTSPLAYGTAAINGQAYAHGDSLYASLQPSEFYLNNNRWEIPGGNRIVLAEDYLDIDNLFLRSGLQQLSIASEGDGTLLAQMQNLDIAQLSAFAGESDLQPDGRLNGEVRIKNIFTDLLVEGNIKASGVRLGVDTIGDVIVIGGYDAKKGLVKLEEQSGIFRGNSSLTATGNLFLDTTSNQKLQGQVKLNNAPLNWLSPVLRGYVSQLAGTLNGTINVGGTAAAPDVEGSVTIKDARLRVDYLGTVYTIPAAKVGVTNTAINIGTITLNDVYNNEATLTGRISHNRFKNFLLSLNLLSEEFELVNLRDYENPVFYGHLIANTKVAVTGPVDNIRINISKAIPVKASQLYLPMTDDGGTGSYSYISFLNLGEAQEEVFKSKNKLSITINALANPLLEVSLILDATTGDRIMATGNGSILMEMPANEDLRLYGNYVIESGTYTFTFKQLFFTREFLINSGSRISFSGPVEQTELDVKATYRTRASLYDLLDSREVAAFRNESAGEQADTKRMQDVNVQLAMKGKLSLPELRFKIELPERRSVGTLAYTKLERLNQNDQQLFEQVASLLLIGYFLPPEGITGSGANTATTGAVNNISQILSTSTSQQLTNIVNKVLGDQKLSIEFKYKNYNLSDANTATGATPDILNRNEVKLGLRRNFFGDRLIVEVGSAYDWGRPTATNANASNFNILGDFRLQYLLNPAGRLRLNAFRTSNYDALAATAGLRNISRSGVGISWRKSFDNVGDFFRSQKALTKQAAAEEGNSTVDSTTIKKAGNQ